MNIIFLLAFFFKNPVQFTQTAKISENNHAQQWQGLSKTLFATIFTALLFQASGYYGSTNRDATLEICAQVITGC